MYAIEADAAKTLIVISALGDVTAEEVREAARQVREIVQDFAPGFCVLTDFRWLQKMDPAAATHVGKIMDAVAEKQVGSVLRVIPDPQKDIGFNILSQFHYGSKVSVRTFATLADAVAVMAEPRTNQSTE